MKRSVKLLTFVLLTVVAAGCQNTTVPERRDIFGSWISRSFPEGTLRMTLTETARAVEGAGSYVTETTAEAFRASGALADDEISLLLEFDTRENVNFQGVFTDEDTIEGSLTGGGFSRVPVVLAREDLRMF